MNRTDPIRDYAGVTIAAAMCLLVTAPVAAQAPADFEGTWSTTVTLPDDPGWVSEDYYCFWGCTVNEIERFGVLLDDPANDERSVDELFGEASLVGTGDFRNALLPAAQADWDARTIENNLDDICTPYGYFAISVSVMPLRITAHNDHLELFYETHDSQRIIHWADSAPPPPDEHVHFGYSLARIEDGALVIETSHVTANPFYVVQALGLKHTDQLTGVERYTLSDDGRQIDMVFTIQDSELLASPLMWHKRWRRADDLELVHHEYDCSFVPGQR